MFALGISIWNRGVLAGKTVATIESGLIAQHTSAGVIQQQAVALQGYASSMTGLSEALKDISMTMREFTSKQGDTNDHMWNAIAVIADQNRRALESKRLEG